MKKIIYGKMYDTSTAEMLASNHFRDGSNRLQHGRGIELYKTAKGNFFAVHETCWQGEKDSIEPLTVDEAKALFESYGDADLWSEIFGASPEEA